MKHEIFSDEKYALFIYGFFTFFGSFLLGKLVVQLKIKGQIGREYS